MPPLPPDAATLPLMLLLLAAAMPRATMMLMRAARYRYIT